MQKESLNDNYYVPSEDSFFLADYLENEKKGRSALDIGTGSGLLATVLSKNFDLVVATDTNFSALKKAHEKAVDNLLCCNAADPFRATFDLIVCNLPYLPSESLTDPAVDGLQGGVDIPFMIIKSASDKIAKNGKLVFLSSSLANYPDLMKKTQSLGFQTKIIAKKRLFFEELILVECTKRTNHF